jgi:hypothetical protein
MQFQFPCSPRSLDAGDALHPSNKPDLLYPLNAHFPLHLSLLRFSSLLTHLTQAPNPLLFLSLMLLSSLICVYIKNCFSRFFSRFSAICIDAKRGKCGRNVGIKRQFRSGEDVVSQQEGSQTELRWDQASLV